MNGHDDLQSSTGIKISSASLQTTAMMNTCMPAFCRNCNTILFVCPSVHNDDICFRHTFRHVPAVSQSLRTCASENFTFLHTKKVEETQKSLVLHGGGHLSDRHTTTTMATTTTSSITSNHSVIRIVFFFLGIGILLPWNSFISAKPYFQARLCRPDGRDWIGNVELWFSMISNVSSVLTLGIIVFYKYLQDERRTSAAATAAAEENVGPSSSLVVTRRRRKNNRLSLLMPLWIYLLVMLWTAVSVLIPLIPPQIFGVVSLAGLFVCGVCQSVVTADIVAQAGLYDASVGIHPYFTGQAVGGMAVAIVNLVTASLEKPDSYLAQYCGVVVVATNDTTGTCLPYRNVQWTTFSYFALGCVVIALCIQGWNYILQQAEDQQPQQQTEDITPQQTKNPLTEPLLAMADGLALTETDCETDSSTIGSLSNHDDASSHVEETTWIAAGTNETRRVWLTIRWNAVALFWTYFVTLALFPVWTSQLHSVHRCRNDRSRFTNDLFTPMTFVVFNTGDFLGRVLAAKLPLLKPVHLTMASLGRVVFFVLFCLCAARDSALGPIVIQSDVYSYAVQIIFAVSNGVLNSQCFLHAALPVGQVQGKVSEILNLALSLGLLVGSLASFPYFRIATGHG